MSQRYFSLVGINKADVLAALYNASRPLGMGFMQYNKKPMTREEAQVILDGGQTYFDYLNGRVMKVDLGGDSLDMWGYDRDNGDGAALMAVQSLQATGDTNPIDVQTMHEVGKTVAAEDLTKHLEDESVLTGNTLKMGFSDVAEHLRPAIDKALNK